MKQLLAIGLLLLCLAPQVLAVDFNAELSDEDKATFDGILEPVMNVYNFIKYAATVIAVIAMIFAGLGYIINANDQGKREASKKAIGYIVIGLIIIWVAPLVVQFMVGG